MHTDTPKSKKPTGSANNPAGHTDDVIVQNMLHAIKGAVIRMKAIQLQREAEQAARNGADGVSAFTIEPPDISKEILTLRAQYALHGYALHCQRQIEGVDQFYAERNRKVHHLPSLDEAQRFLAQIGGAHE